VFKFSANLGFLFTEVPFLERFAAAARAGFRYVEMKSPYDFDPADLVRQLESNGLATALINLPDGDWGAGDRGLAADPARKQEFRESVPRAAEMALRLQAPRVNCLTGNAPAGMEPARVEANLVENLDFLAWEFAKAGLDVTVEPLNKKDNPLFYLSNITKAAALLKQVHHNNIYLQYDVYHEAQEDQDLIAVLRQYHQMIGHIQVADLPGRHEPGSGALDYAAWFKVLTELDYQGFIGMEYNPSAGTDASLAWLELYGLVLS
jgi:hydroxypyruvate isomerase